MTEQEAIERIRQGINRHLHAREETCWTEASLAQTAWDQMKAIAREDALTVHLPRAKDVPGLTVTAHNQGDRLAIRSGRHPSVRP